MRTLSAMLVALGLMLGLTNPAAADSKATVDAFVAAVNKSDQAAVKALLAPNAGYAYSLDGALTTGDRFEAWLQSDIFGPSARVRIDQVLSATPARVDTHVTWGRGSPTTEARYVFDVADGKITGWRMMRR